MIKVKERYLDGVIYFDVMKAPVKRIQNKFRYQVLVRCKLDDVDRFEKELFECIDENCKSSVFFEVNPQNMS